MADQGKWAEINVKFDGFTRIDFEKKRVRKGMQMIGQDVRKEARKLIARRAISRPGEAPGRMTGATFRSIKYKVSRPGFLVRIAPYRTTEMGNKEFYPAILNVGSNKTNLKARSNYMIEALERRSNFARKVLLITLQNSLTPRK